MQSVTNARAGLTDAYNNAQAISGEQATASEESLQQYQQAQNALKGALDIYVNAVREAYPDLKANDFLNKQIDIILTNQEEIKQLKLDKASLNAYHFWLWTPKVVN